MASSDIQSKTNGQSNQMALFFIDKETYGININTIKEIVRVPELTTVPNAPPFLSGLTNLRNKVLPVIDSRRRLNLSDAKLSDNSRILVLDTKGSTTGIIVDKVKGVVSIDDKRTEMPPEILSSGIDRKFIKSVIKLSDSDKIIMEFDINTLCDIKWEEGNEIFDTDTQIQQTDNQHHNSVAEIQMVTFMLSDEEYSFPIDIVREVLRVGNLTKVPNTPSYIMGILTVRNTVLPILDMRKLFGMQSLLDELYVEFDTLEHQKRKWFDALKLSIESGSTFKENTKANVSELGVWIENFRSVSQDVGEVLQELRYANIRLFDKTQKLLNERKTLNEKVLKERLHKDIEQTYNQLCEKIKDLRLALKKGIVEDQRIMVVDINSVPIGLLVDRVQQVLRVPENIMENPPAVLNSNKSKTLKSIAKLNNGKRIILLLDDNELISLQHISAIKEINKGMNQEKKHNYTNSQEEETQLVTFSLGNSQFAIGIEEVKEINRLDTITVVPQTSSFIEGIMNLRGNVIPVINLRKRFSMPEKTYDGNTKVIIVNMLDKLTGLIVDSVSEVLRMPKRNIEPTPAILKSGIDIDFLKGVVKIDKTNKMLMLISVSKILTVKQQEELRDTYETEENNF